MMRQLKSPVQETKFYRFEVGQGLSGETEISGYASVFGSADQNKDVVQSGAYLHSLKALKSAGSKVKMLWQHDPSQPIGIWDAVHEDGHGLFVKGRILEDVQAGREALSLLRAGAIDGLSIGYRTVRSERDQKGQRLLHEIELWEVSLVTFPMLPEARVNGAENAADTLAQDLVETISSARESLLA